MVNKDDRLIRTERYPRQAYPIREKKKLESNPPARSSLSPILLVPPWGRKSKAPNRVVLSPSLACPPRVFGRFSFGWQLSMSMPIRRQCDAKLSCGLGIGYFFSNPAVSWAETGLDRAGGKLGPLFCLCLLGC